MPTYLHLFLGLLGGYLLADEPRVRAPWFGIHVTDEQTGRGIPLVELRTVNDVRGITDNAGWIAFLEPGLMDREVWFYVSLAPGYELAKDGFGYVGLRVKTTPGTATTLKLKRTSVAERIARTTGQGLFRDSELLGLPCALPNLGNAGVMGQDSEQAVPYRGKTFWLWGDTNVPHYPLGNFQTTCAFSSGEPTPEQGIAFDYLTDPQKPDTPRHMLPLKEPGAVWLFGLLNLHDTMFAHYSRHKSLDDAVEHGIARFDDQAGHFVVAKQLDKTSTWQYPRGQAVRSENHFYFSDGFLNTRVIAEADAITDPLRYEALRYDETSHTWHWQKASPPTTQSEESKLLLQGKMRPQDARFRLKDVSTNKLVRLHGGSVQWNAHRQRWILIGLQHGDRDDPSPLGEVWYAESKQPEGPWTTAIKVATHPRYSFYNPVHHAFLDADGGRIIYFEGTYSLEFSGNPLAPARYDYNQLQYRLDLDDARLKPTRAD